MVTNVSGGDTVFSDGIIYSDQSKRYHVIKHLYDRCDVGPFEILFHEGTLWRGHRAVI